MKTTSTVVLLAAVALAMASWGGEGAFAQAQGPQVAVKGVDPVLRAAAEVVGLVRTRNLTVGNMNLPVFDAEGTMIDVEAGGTQVVPVSRYTLSVAIYEGPASRVDFEGPTTPRTIRVVKGSRAWNETWNKEKTKIGTTPAGNAAAYRSQMVWFQPQTFLHMAIFASAKKCLDGKDCLTPLKIGIEGGKSVVEMTINNVVYKATMGIDKRPERIEGNVAMPQGGTKKVVAMFSDWRAAEKPDAGFSPVFGANVLDKFHNGTYWPSRIVHEVDGTKVLDIKLTAGWGNPYEIFPEPEILAKVQ